MCNTGGFIIQFAFDNLQKVECAHFGLLRSYYEASRQHSDKTQHIYLGA